MSFSAIRLLHFRNYQDVEIKSFGRTNLILGENGSGKTNLLEALFFLARLLPIRSINAAGLVQWNEAAFYLRGEIDGDIVETGFSPQRKMLKLNQKPITASEYALKNPSVAFLPDDITIVTGSPDERRDFIDSALGIMDQEYRIQHQRYQRALKQRNAQLKLNPKDAPIWDHELVQSGSRIIEKRLQWVQSTNLWLKKWYERYYNSDIGIRYFNTFRIEASVAASFQKALELSRPSEVLKRHTLVGPHRDNFEIEQGDKAARTFASQGQRRGIALALKLSMAQSLETLYHKKPILLFDDVLLELDDVRRNKFLEEVTPNYQTFFTATGNTLFQPVLNDSLIISVSKGRVTVNNDAVCLPEKGI